MIPCPGSGQWQAKLDQPLQEPGARRLGSLPDGRRMTVMNDQTGDLSWQYAQMEATFANLPIGVIVFDAGQKLVLVNPAYLRTYDLQPGSLKPGAKGTYVGSSDLG